MKVELTKYGLLKVEAENDLESYALRKWVDENMEIIENQNLNKNIVILFGIEDKPDKK